jgi:radical SAM superfamily enzyme YgiQ (UPF0313 family)
MKVLFVYPNAGSQLGFNYGVAHLSAVLKEAGHETQCLQLCEDLAPLPTQEAFVAALREASPDVVGFSVVTTQWPYAERLARWAREAGDFPICCGGIHATVATDEVLQSGAFDYVFVGECEDAFAEFVDRLARGEDVRDVRNLGYLRDNAVHLNPVRPLPDLQHLPPKDYDLFDFQHLVDAKRGWVGLMASRGCPFSCTYCFNHRLVHQYRADLNCSFRDLNYIRHFDVGVIIDEIRNLLSRYRGIRMFIFDDDLFTFDRDYVVEFCKAYRELTDLPFVVNAHVGFFDEDRAKALADANCRIVKLGLESGSPRVRNQIMNRHMTNDAIVQALATIERFGMHSSVFVMLGLPHERREDLMQTVELLGLAKPGRFRWTFFYPFPGTRAHEITLEGGFVDERRMSELTNFTDASCLEFGPEQNLLLRKLGRILPWFVNAASDFECRQTYARRVEEILPMDEAAWNAVADDLRQEDQRLSKRMVDRGLRHYAIKYNPFMGVISDYFLNEP